MFTWRHFVWLFICTAVIVVSLICLKKYKVSLQRMLSIGCVVSILSEITKVVSVIRMVPSSDGSMIYPYMQMNHLPLHLCSIQILLIFYVRFTENKRLRENVLAFMYPACLLGALMALAMPSIFTTSIRIEQAFTHPMAYQFFSYHTMLIILGIYIAISGEIHWELKHLRNTYIIIALMAFLSLYLNSMFASPVYLNGELQSVEFWPNFFFTYNNPLNIKVTTIGQWYNYLLIIANIAIVLIFLCYAPLIFKKKKRNTAKSKKAA